MKKCKNIISVIVPVYKVDYTELKRCIDSILNQTYKDIELILVDDGSPDKCGIICDEFAKKNDNVKVIHKENGGVSSARNTGIEAATGQYIGFVDSDDYLEEDMYQILIDNALSDDYDISMCGYKGINLDGTTFTVYGTNKKEILNFKRTMKYFLSNDKFGDAVWNKIIKRKLIIDNNIRFKSEIKINEDKLFLFNCIQNSNKNIYYDICKYNYIKREGSASSSEFSSKKLDVLKVIDLIKSANLSEEFKPYLKKNEIICSLQVYRNIKFSKNSSEFEDVVKKIKKLILETDNKFVKDNLNKFVYIEFIIIKYLSYIYLPFMKLVTKFTILKKVKTRMIKRKNMTED